VSSSFPTDTTCVNPTGGDRERGGRTSAATPEVPRTGSRTSAARVAADVRPNPEILTDKPPPPTPSRPRRSAPTSVEEADDALLDARDLAALEARLAETDGLRPALQAQARAELTAEGMPVIRSTVARRARAILDVRHPQ